MIDHVADLREPVDILDANVAQWRARDHDAPEPGARQAADGALTACDEILGEVYRIRSQITTEVRSSDDAALARADALLRDRRGGP